MQPTLGKIASLGDGLTMDQGEGSPGYARAIKEALLEPGPSEESLYFRGNVPASAIPIMLRRLHRADRYRERVEMAAIGKHGFRVSDLEIGAKEVGRMLALTASIGGEARDEVVRAFTGAQKMEKRFQASRIRDKLTGNEGGEGA